MTTSSNIKGSSYHCAYPPSNSNFPYDVIVVTSPNELAAKAALTGPLKSLVSMISQNSSAKESDREVLILSTNDPYNSKMGSGGGTIAALTEADFMWKKRQEEKHRSFQLQSENKSAKIRKIDSEIEAPSILIIHAGGDSSRCPTQMTLGKAWTSLPVSSSSTTESSTSSVNIVTNPTAMIVQILSTIFLDLPKGSVTVAASDVLVSIPAYHSCSFIPKNIDKDYLNLVLGLGIPGPLQVAKNHGVFVCEQKLNNSTNNGDSISSSSLTLPVQKFLQKPSVLEMKNEPKCCFSPSFDSSMNHTESFALIDSGVVTFLTNAAITLRELASSPDGPMLKCTQHGLYSLYEKKYQQHHDDHESIEQFAKSNALQIELYSHIMLALSTQSDTTHKGLQAKKDDYLKEHTATTSKLTSPSIVKSHDPRKPTYEALSELYDRLSSLPFHACIINDGQFCHLGTTREMIDLLTYGNCCSYENYDHLETNDVKTKVSDIPNNSITTSRQQECQNQSDYVNRCRQFGQQYKLTSRASSFIISSNPFHPSSIILNSTIDIKNSEKIANEKYSVGAMTLLEHCIIQSSANCSILIGNNCLLSGIRGSFSQNMIIPDKMCLQMLPLMKTWKKFSNNDISYNGTIADSEALHLKQDDIRYFVCIMLNIDDDIKKRKTILGLTMERFMNVTGLRESEIWPSNIDPSHQKLWNANLHPVFSGYFDATKTETDDKVTKSDIDLSLIFTWISELIAKPFIKNEDELTAIGKSSLLKWKKLTRISLQSIRASSDAFQEYNYRQSLTNTISKKKEDTLQNISSILLDRKNLLCHTQPFIDSYFGGNGQDLEKCLDAINSVMLSSIKSENYDIASRCFMVLSLSFTYMSTMLKDSTVTPKSNTFNECFNVNVESLRGKEKLDICHKMIEVCNNIFTESFKWCPPHSYRQAYPSTAPILECASMFEFAAKILTECCVGPLNCEKPSTFNSIDSSLYVPIGKWAIASAPARIDISGGWSDTSPISYEFGGSVTCLAVKVDNQKPFLARSRKVKGGGIRLVTEKRCPMSGNLIENQAIDIRHVEDLLDFRNPFSHAALLKAALICLGIVPQELLNVSTQKTNEMKKKTILQPFLDSFLNEQGNNNIGIEIVSTSLLPRGSGMGGSSILGGCVLASIGSLLGYNVIASDVVENNSKCNKVGKALPLTHAVLVLEQLMTTGGGWQDQIGGLVGGLKIARSTRNCIPLEIKVEPIPLDTKAQKELERRLILVFTGKQRLAKNLLENVLRSWAKRSDEIMDTVQNLVKGAEEVAHCFADGNINKVGEYMSNYWKQKKIMVGENGNAEPECVKKLLSFLYEKEDIIGATLCGAGGGGFMVMLAREGLCGNDLKDIVMKEEHKALKELEISEFSWHDCTICDNGLEIKMLDMDESDTIEKYDLKWHY